MLSLRHGHYIARLAASPDDHAAAQALRYRCFVEFAGLKGLPKGRDTDPFDAACLQMLVEDETTGALACTYRLLPLKTTR